MRFPLLVWYYMIAYKASPQIPLTVSLAENFRNMIGDGADLRRVGSSHSLAEYPLPHCLGPAGLQAKAGPHRREPKRHTFGCLVKLGNWKAPDENSQAPILSRVTTLLFKIKPIENSLYNPLLETPARNFLIAVEWNPKFYFSEIK